MGPNKEQKPWMSMQLDPIHTLVTIVDHLITLQKIVLINQSNNKNPSYSNPKQFNNFRSNPQSQSSNHNRQPASIETRHR